SGAPVTLDRAVPSALSGLANSSISVSDAIFQVPHSALCDSEILGFIERPPLLRSNTHPKTDCTPSLN
ncbi:MAG: hypothetical protein WCD02_13360, partial [Terriglobales bacterium]